jgi:amino acid permease
MNMNIAVPLVVVFMVLLFGLVFALFPRWGMKLVCRSASSYMKEDLSSDPVYVLAFRFYGIAAVGVGLYALYQVLQAL